MISTKPIWANIPMHRFELGKGYSINSITMRELMAYEHDVVEANAEAFHGAKSGKNQEARSYARVIESVRLSVVEVDGVMIDGDVPYQGIDSWSQKTLSMVISLYVKINGTDDTEIERFLAQSKPVTFAELGRGLQQTSVVAP